MHHFTLRRVAVAGLAASLVCVGAASYGPVLPTAVVAARPITIPVVLTAAIDEAPTTLGIADSDLYRLSAPEIAVTLDRLKALGVNDVRVAVPWIYIQTQDNENYDWAKMDLVVRAAAEREMNVIGVISGTPGWAGFPINGHSDPDDYARFATAVADRYKDDTIGEIGTYEVWNEPNGALFYNPVSAAAYTEMLRAAYPAIKSADPDAVVLAGVLGSVATFAGLSLRPDTFVAQMYDNGAHGYFDALSFHPYHYTLPFSRGDDVNNSPINQVAAIRALMAARGDDDLKIWVTEYGLPTNPQISEARQAAFIRDFVVRWQDIDGAGPIFIYSTRDSASGAFDDENNFGIYRTDWTPKRAAAAIADLIEDLADGTAEPFDVTPYLSTNSFLDSVFIVARQIASLLLIVPRALFQLAASAVTVVVQAIGAVVTSLSGQAAPAALREAEPTATVAESRAPEAAVATTDCEDASRKRPVPEITPVDDAAEPDESVASDGEDLEPVDAESDDPEADDDHAADKALGGMEAATAEPSDASTDGTDAIGADDTGDERDEAADTTTPGLSKRAEKKSGRVDTP